MTPLKGVSILAAATLLVAGAVSAISAQAPGTGQRASRTYDVKTEATIEGTVEAVETVKPEDARGRRALGGTHLVVKAGKDTREVHVGPTAYLAEKGITLTKGDSVEILGSQVTVDGEAVLIAKRIKKGDTVWTLRDASGRPLWAGRGR